MSADRFPWQLPAGHLIQAVKGHAEGRRQPLWQVVPPGLMRRYERAARERYITVDTADLLCEAILGRDASALYDPEEVVLARKAMVARRRVNRPRSHPQTAMTLADYQRVWDLMAAEAADGRWTGVLAEVVSRAEVPATYGAVVQVLRSRGWIRVEVKGYGNTSGTIRPSVVALLARPEPSSWPCANPACDQTISSVTPDGRLTTGKLVNCSTACENAVQGQALGRKLDQLRRAVALPLTGRTRLNQTEVDQVLKVIGRLRSRP
jgi:hypothetical protein